MSELDQMRALLAAKAEVECNETYLAPAFLAGGECYHCHLVDVGNPFAYYVGVLDEIASLSVDRRAVDNSSYLDETDTVYVSFVRTFASLNGEVGSALKQIAFVPFLRDTLGVTVLLLLPSGVIGSTNRKGTRGSPFAVRNPFDIDPSFGDPLLPEMSALDQYRALVQACRFAGMRAGSVVPLATLAIDSPLFALFPEIGYWWTAPPGERAHLGQADVASWFRRAPEAGAVRWHDEQGQTYLVGVHETQPAELLTLANACPDVVAGEPGLYTWDDVALIRYSDPNVPLPAGQHDSTAAPGPDVARSLMAAVLAWRHIELGEDVFVVDVARSVPGDVLQRAHALAAQWPTGLSARLAALTTSGCTLDTANAVLAEIRRVGTLHEVRRGFIALSEELWGFEPPTDDYDGVTGPLAVSVAAHSWNLPVMLGSLTYHIGVLAERPPATPYLAAVATHDTIPPDPVLAALSYVCYSFLPSAVLTVFAGTEWGCQQIINKEFGFSTTAELRRLRDSLTTADMALFNDTPVGWDDLASRRQPEGRAEVVRVLEDLRVARQEVGPMFRWRLDVFETPSVGGKSVLMYTRMPTDEGGGVAVVANFGTGSAPVRLPVDDARLVLRFGFEDHEHPRPDDTLVELPGRSCAVWAWP